MRAPLVFPSTLFGALLVLSGCDKGATPAPPPPWSPGDASVPVRPGVKADASVEASAGDARVSADSGGDAPTTADSGDDVPATTDGGDASVEDAAVDAVEASALPPSITVTVDTTSLVPPADGGVPATLIVPASYGPKPVVTVTVVSNSGDIRADDVSSVMASLNDSTGVPVTSVKLARSETDSFPETNTARFIFSDVPLDLSKVATGAYDLVVTATTVGGDSASADVALWVDTGPAVVVKSPTEGGFYKGSAPVEVDATQVKYAITLVTMALGQGDAVSLMPTVPGVYKGNIDFNSFSPPLEGEQLATFRAYDENGVETVVARHFVSDDTGPSISATVPELGAMIGGVIKISATVEDKEPSGGPGSGVDKSSVVAVVGNGDHTFEVALIQQPTGEYANLFDTTKLPSYAIFPTISFRARDVLGNESTVSYELSLDNTPPVIDLDPPNVRLVREDGTCSWAFDPVGPDAVDDGDLVSQLFDVRVRAEDRGNTPLTGTADFVPIAGLDQGKVQLLLLSNTQRPLVVDTSDPPDGLCDDINPDLVPTTKPQTDADAQVVNMLQLSPSSNADFSPEPGVSCSGGDSPPKFDSFCATTGNESKAQYPSDDSVDLVAHCDSMTAVLSYSVDRLASIYTIGPIVGNGLECAGHQFDASNNLKDGWACLAVTASDKRGNKQVSRPIRICVVATKPSTACSEFKPLTGIVFSDPVEIQTAVPLVGPGGAALQPNDEVIVSGVVGIRATVANGRWPVTPLDSSGTRFSLQGAHPKGTAASALLKGVVVPVAVMPDCTGTVIKARTDAGLPVVDYTKPCKPWRRFPPGEYHGQ